MVEAFDYNIPNLFGDPSKGISYGSNLSEISVDSDLIDAGLVQRKKLIIQQDDSRNEINPTRNETEIRLHEAKEDLHSVDKPHPLENDSNLNALVEGLFGKVQEEVLNFEHAREILGPYIDSHQGQVSTEAFEEAIKFFLELGSSDVLKVYTAEKEEAKAFKPSRVMSAVEQIKHSIATGDKDAKALKAALRKAGLSTKNLSERASKFDEVNQSFSESFADVYFFLREKTSKETPDADVFEEQMKPLLEMIKTESNELQKPSKPQVRKKMSAGQKKNLAAKQRAYPGKLAKYDAGVKKFISKVHTFVKELS